MMRRLFIPACERGRNWDEISIRGDLNEPANKIYCSDRLSDNIWRNLVNQGNKHILHFREASL